ncbi:MAG: hypothetical protein F6K10_14360 [Moorea sp. SIO2B7]|nr:hypothetical protein [Moorena sp. SIO2B7]
MPWRFAGPPQPRPDSQTRCVILDGQNVDKDPVATLHLSHHIPYGLHGSWTPQCFQR